MFRINKGETSKSLGEGGDEWEHIQKEDQEERRVKSSNPHTA